MKKIEINNKLYNVISAEEYIKNRKIHNPKFTAIESDDNDTILPISTKSSDAEPGMYFYEGCNPMVVRVITPSEKDKPNYSKEKMIDYTKAKTLQDIIDNNKLLRDIQDDIITTSDNVLQLNISDSDSPEMRALKTAINSKAVDKKQYEDRFDQFQNDMRLLKGNTITLGKLISICSAFDISAELTLSDRNGAPNPIGKEISVELTDRGDN